MLRSCLQLLRNAAGQQALAAALEPSAISSLGSAAAASSVLQIAQRQSLWAALEAGGCRLFSSSAARGDGGSEQGPPAAGSAGAAAGGEQQQAQLDAELDGDEEEAALRLGFDLEDRGLVLEEWGKAMDAGDWDRAWDIFESAFPTETGEYPPLEALLQWDPEADEKAARRARELELQEAFARSRVRRVDEQERSLATGKRKTSIARVWLRPGAGHIMVNQKPFDRYFPSLLRRNDLITPFVVTGTLGAFDVMVRVRGGGNTGQAQAVRHGIARALQLWAPELRPPLKSAGLLTRDSRIVERKKPGRKKARKAFQWVKR